MESLVSLVNNLKKEIKPSVDSRLKEFSKIPRTNKELFKELCFCILTANFTADRSIIIQKRLGNKVITLSEAQLAKELKKLGHRFPNARANYIVESRAHIPNLKNNLNREWLVKNIKGLGYKEASHFLRNIGELDHAILDFHILDILSEHKIIEKPKILSKKNYLEIEQTLNKLAKKTNLFLGELDFYLWYAETGKVLK